MKTIKELSEIHGLDRSTLLKAARQGRVPAKLSGAIWLVDEESEIFKDWLNGANLGRPRSGSSVKPSLKHGCEIARGHGVEVGLMQTEQPDKPEAYLMWLDGAGVMGQREWAFCTRTEAIFLINSWLGDLDLALQKGQIVEH